MEPDPRVREAAERNRRRLCDLLTGPPNAIARELREALLDFASETADNLDCVDRIDFGSLPAANGMPAHLGLRLRRSGLSVAEVLHTAEGTALPADLSGRHPAVTQADWDAVLRLATLVFSALERPE